MIDNSQLAITQKISIYNLSSAIDLAIGMEVNADKHDGFVLQDFITNPLLKNLNDKLTIGNYH